MQMTTAFDPLQLGHVQLANRIAMSPMTRSRADVASWPLPSCQRPQRS
jgi:2,4-dienoyl-CoA reductase-like NADH-dependent reductase (Old Yellow Enzyme family)